ncbi:MAG: hypothetical protein U5L96_03145 [Owenweeksia sp.]|nr:hypothetical protein [Owenweeksia sp.]
MDVEVSTNGGATWTNVYSVTGNIQSSSTDPWDEQFVNLSAYTGDTIMIRFVQVSVGCCGDAAIDSVVIGEAPTCPKPFALDTSNVSATSAVLTWTPGTMGNTNFQITYGHGLSNPNSGTMALLTAATNTLIPLRQLLVTVIMYVRSAPQVIPVIGMALSVLIPNVLPPFHPPTILVLKV